VNVGNTARDAAAGGLFPTTRWTSLLLPVHAKDLGAALALERLFTIYRRPIVEFVRTRARNPADAEDLAHDFIVRLLERDDLARLEPTRGRFRHFLTAAIRNYLANHYNAMDAQKRKSLNEAEPLDLEAETGGDGGLDRQFLQAWWRSTIEEALRRLRSEWERAGQEKLFLALEPLLWNERAPDSIQTISRQFTLTPNALYVRLSRMRERYRVILREVIRETVGSEKEVEEEIRCILQIS
jgi:RNA polymerase sigma factor (sigma-70 family)